MRIGIISSSEDEIIPFVEHITNLRVESINSIKYYIGKYDKINVVALNCTSCKEKASKSTEILIDKFDVTHILISGVAVKVSNNVAIGDTVIATNIATERPINESDDNNIQYNSDVILCDDDLVVLAQNTVKKNIFSQNIFFGSIESYENIKIIHSHEKILCSDFESASIAKICSKKSIPFISIRTIINDKSLLNNYAYEMKRISAAYTSLSIVNRMLRLYKS